MLVMVGRQCLKLQSMKIGTLSFEKHPESVDKLKPASPVIFHQSLRFVNKLVYVHVPI